MTDRRIMMLMIGLVIEAVILITLGVNAKRLSLLRIELAELIFGITVLIFILTLLQSKILTTPVNSGKLFSPQKHFTQPIGFQTFQPGLLGGLIIGFVAWNIVKRPFPFTTIAESGTQIWNISISASRMEWIGSIVGILLATLLVSRFPTIQFLLLLLGESLGFSTSVLALEAQQTHDPIFTYPSHLFIFMLTGVILIIIRFISSRYFRRRPSGVFLDDS
jgi:hypothetical protein